jgi:hypothetical protein
VGKIVLEHFQTGKYQKKEMGDGTGKGWKLFSMMVIS